MGFLCERTPFLSVLKLKHPEQSSGTQEDQDWTAWDVCEGTDQQFLSVAWILTPQ